MFFLGQTIAHCSIAIVTIMVICIVKRGEIASILCLMMMVLGYVILHGLENALSLGGLITDYWAFSQTAFVDFGMVTNWGRIFITFLGYLVVCSVITITFLKLKDIE